MLGISKVLVDEILIGSENGKRTACKAWIKLASKGLVLAEFLTLSTCKYISVRVVMDVKKRKR